MSGLTLNIAIPILHESFYATWKNDAVRPAENAWRVTLPLTLDNRSIGTLSVVGTADSRQAIADIQQLLDFLDTLHGEIAYILENTSFLSEPVVAREVAAALD